MPSNVFAYSEDQPRVSKGNLDGGQWTAEGKESGSSKNDSDNTKTSDKGDDSKAADSSESDGSEEYNPNSSKSKSSRKQRPKANIKESDLVDDKTLSELVNINKPIDPKEIFDKLKFDPNGNGEYINALKGLNPIEIWNVHKLDLEARELTQNIFKGNGRNDKSDAFRHTYFNYRLTELVGVKRAKEYSNAHEISEVNEPGKRIMDLTNNHIGRNLYLNNRTLGKKQAKDVVINSLKNWQLRTKRYLTKSVN